MAPPRTCDCGTCPRCRNREANRRWYQKKTAAERLAHSRSRDSDLRRAANRADYERRRDAILAKSKTRDPIKRKAVNMVNAAIRRGALVRRPCEVCGAQQAEAHHDDYSKPLDVRWLCRDHHAEHHWHERFGVAV